MSNIYQDQIRIYSLPFFGTKRETVDKILKNLQVLFEYFDGGVENLMNVLVRGLLED